MKEKLLKIGVKVPLLFGILSFVILKLALQIKAANNLQAGLIRIAVVIISFFILWPVLQNQHMKFPGTGWKSSIKISRSVIIFSLILFLGMFCLMVFSSMYAEFSNLDIIEGEKVAKLRSDWPLQLFYLIVLLIGVGTVEEMVFRRGLFCCLNKQFGSVKNALLISAIVSSIFFGYVHVSASFTSDKFEFACSVLKTIETGMWGFIICSAFYDSQNIWPVSIIHAVGDGSIMFGSLWDANADIGKYTYGSDNPMMATGALVMYCVCIIVYMPAVIRAFKMFKGAKNL